MFEFSTEIDKVQCIILGPKNGVFAPRGPSTPSGLYLITLTPSFESGLVSQAGYRHKVVHKKCTQAETLMGPIIFITPCSLFRVYHGPPLSFLILDAKVVTYLQ